MDTPVRLFWSATFTMILYQFRDSFLPCTSLTTNQTKHHTWILSLFKWLCVSSSLLHYISIHVFASMTLPYFVYFIKCALDFCKAWIKLLGWQSKASRIYFLINSHCHHPPVHFLTYIQKQLWCILQFILNRNHWFAHWLSKDLCLLHKLSCHSCCSCWSTQFVCEKQWM